MTENINYSGEENILLPPDPARVMEGLRDTGYNFVTAVADIVDNSVAAEATLVDIRLEMNPLNEVTVYFADNGHGMDLDGLHNAMKYGSDVRDNPSSLGKFGLGLKTASTAFCRCLSVVSRSTPKDSFRKVQWNLDYIAQSNQWLLLHPEIEEHEIEILNEVVKDGTGTLVVWEQTDRILRAYTKPKFAQNALARLEKELRFHLSMVYHRFLSFEDKRARNVVITLNGENVVAWDPYCTQEEKTELLATDRENVEFGDGTISSFELKAYMIPRRDEFSSKEAEQEARISNKYQGFFIYRENRMIYNGWLGMFDSEPHGSLLRVEFSFGHELDEALNVDIKKSKVTLASDIYDHVKDFLSAPRRAANERYRKGTVKATTKESKGAHSASNQNIGSKATGVESSKVEIVNPETNEVNVTNAHGTFKHTITVKTTEEPDQSWVDTVSSLEDGILWAPTIINQKHAVQINESHPYYQKIYRPLLEQSVVITGMDALLWSLAEAELSSFNGETKEQYEDMRMLVSRILRKLVADLPDPVFAEDEEV